LKKRILIGFIAIILAFSITAALLSAAVVQSVAREQLLEQLTLESGQIARRLAGKDPVSTLQQGWSTSRVSLIEPDGGVLYDSWTDQPLENHVDRPEIALALQEGFGSAVRYSDTAKSMAIYAATRLPDGTILRVAAPERVARGIAQGVAPYMVFGLVLIVILSIFFVNFLVDKLVKPLLTIDLDHPEDAVVYDEVLPLIRRIDQQNKHNRQQLLSLEARRVELNTLLDGMHEGFIALGEKEEIILLNPAACAMLGISQQEALGRSLVEVNRSPAILAVLEALRSQGTARGELEKDGRVYQLLANSIAGRPGAILLLSDQTYKMAGEAMRKRFTANVSHELRTPLTNISGYAELLDKGMVQEGDKGNFYALIHRESSRMLTLIEDILRLSRLDEGYAGGSRAKVNLHEQARAACQTMELSADEKEVTLHYEGEDAPVLGDATLLYELCANLVDNAIKYNVTGGSVTVRVSNGAQPVLTVADTGIGIAPEHQPQVFERFYRIDKSRSKQTGGTGLGLSIVKHAAEYHRARLSLHSQPGKGTTITVAFPPYREPA